MNKNSLPNFILVGAMKSGTTSMYNYLNEHPQIYLPYTKEPRFFISIKLLNKENLDNRYLNPNSVNPINNLSSYKDLFTNVKNEIAVGEASPQYLITYESTIPLIKKYLGDIKILIILRNPVDRSFSAYKHNRRLKHRTTKILHEKLSLKDALKQEEERIKTREFPLMFYYKTLSMYYDQVKSYKDNFSEVFICKFEDLEANPLLLMKNIYTFLEVDNNFTPNTEIKYNIGRSTNLNFIQKRLVNINKHTRWKIMKRAGAIIGDKNLNTLLNLILKKDPTQIDKESLKFLKKEFREDILKLENLTNLDLQDWLK